jgi:hypothetical protein
MRRRHIQVRLSTPEQKYMSGAGQEGPRSGAFWQCAEHVRQLGGASPLHNVMDVK